MGARTKPIFVISRGIKETSGGDDLASQIFLFTTGCRSIVVCSSPVGDDDTLTRSVCFALDGVKEERVCDLLASVNGMKLDEHAIHSLFDELCERDVAIFVVDAKITGQLSQIIRGCYPGKAFPRGCNKTLGQLKMRHFDLERVTCEVY